MTTLFKSSRNTKVCAPSSELATKDWQHEGALSEQSSNPSLVLNPSKRGDVANARTRLRMQNRSTQDEVSLSEDRRMRESKTGYFLSGATIAFRYLPVNALLFAWTDRSRNLFRRTGMLWHRRRFSCKFLLRGYARAPGRAQSAPPTAIASCIHP